MELEQILRDEHYIKYANTFYKVQGDGILIVIRFEKEHAIKIPMLFLGLNSMFSKFDDNIKSPRSLPTQYPVFSFIDKSVGPVFSADCSVVTGWYYPGKEEQTEIFRDNCLPETRNLATQNDLIDLIVRMEKRVYHMELINNFDKIAPYLSSNQYQGALIVINAIINQNVKALMEIQAYLLDNYHNNKKLLRIP
jgi:hypothetical protein